MLGALAALARPPHWIKNLVVLAPLVFSGRLREREALTLSLATFVAFCLLSSSAYILNDLHDAALDRNHPLKQRRPLAAGTVRPGAALALALVCLVLGLGIGWRVQQLAPPPAEGEGLELLGTFRWCALYVALGAVYTAVLKRFVVADAVSIAASFVLRAFAGAAALGLLPSRWLVACGFCLALFLAFGKRRLEVAQLGVRAQESRPMVSGYSLRTLDLLVDLSAVLVNVLWVAYTVAPGTVERMRGYGLVLSSPIVIALVLRHRKQIRRGAGSGPVELLLHDPVSLLGFAAWGALVVAVIYGPL
jgi:4-hydroxybenzoate polyprenyltransferase